MFKKMIEKMICEKIRAKYMIQILTTCNDFTFKDDDGIFIDFELNTSIIDWEHNLKDVTFKGFVCSKGVSVTMIPYAD